MKKFFKKVVCMSLALASVAGASLAMSGCTTDHPEVEMQVAFNGKTYSLTYQLYRKFAPNTVEHFLYLAENGYYDGLCVHDYEADKLYTGGYTYDENKTEDGGLTYKSYYDTVKSYEGEFPLSAWVDSDKQVPTYTLYGEFSKNDVKVQNGTFMKQKFGALTMFYTDKGDNDDTIFVEKVDGTGMTSRKYEYNSATSQFFISLAETEKSDSYYCTFAWLTDDDVDTLKSLKADIVSYYESKFSAEDDAVASFAPEVEIAVDEDDLFVGDADLTAKYNVPVEPIVIKSVKVVKY